MLYILALLSTQKKVGNGLYHSNFLHQNVGRERFRQFLSRIDT